MEASWGLAPGKASGSVGMHPAPHCSVVWDVGVARGQGCSQNKTEPWADAQFWDHSVCPDCMDDAKGSDYA